MANNPTLHQKILSYKSQHLDNADLIAAIQKEMDNGWLVAFVIPSQIYGGSIPVINNSFIIVYQKTF